MAWTKFNAFPADLANGIHNLGSDALKIALTNTAPISTDETLADISEITSAGGYAAATVPVSSSAQSGGLYSLVIDPVTWTASGAAFDAFRYLVLFNDTAASKNLIAYADYGISYVLPDGQPFTHQTGTILTIA